MSNFVYLYDIPPRQPGIPNPYTRPTPPPARAHQNTTLHETEEETMTKQIAGLKAFRTKRRKDKDSDLESGLFHATANLKIRHSKTRGLRWWSCCRGSNFWCAMVLVLLIVGIVAGVVAGITMPDFEGSKPK